MRSHEAGGTVEVLGLGQLERPARLSARPAKVVWWRPLRRDVTRTGAAHSSPQHVRLSVPHGRHAGESVDKLLKRSLGDGIVLTAYRRRWALNRCSPPSAARRASRMIYVCNNSRGKPWTQNRESHRFFSKSPGFC